MTVTVYYQKVRYVFSNKESDPHSGKIMWMDLMSQSNNNKSMNNCG